MPTARELLEQADALMRRNRQEAARATREPTPAQGPRSVAPAAVPSLPAGGPTKYETPTLSAKGNEIEIEDVPILRDAIAPPRAARGDDDVPVLTDAVHEIDVAAPIVDEGEPSDWMTPPAEDESVLGPSPPSVAVVPPATLPASGAPHREAPPSARVPPPDLEELSQRVYADRDSDVTVRRPAPTLGAPPAPRPTPEIEDLAEASLSDLDPDVTWTRPIAPGSVAAVPIRDSLPEPAAPRVDAAAPPASRSVPSGGEFDALAEEIRMQVLQRIDMFTDTGLRERLGERLKPIVDRASADLVDAINQHVGEILRAYVAEAIEREIDRWKSGR